MPVNLPPLSDLLPVDGVRLGSGPAGVKSGGRERDRDDVAVLALDAGSTVAGVFTRSHFRAPPVALAEARILGSSVRALVINSGNANAATGEVGMSDAEAVCNEVARSLSLDPESVLPFSTGVIGERLPVEAINATVRDIAADGLSERGWAGAARAIMTTDTAPKAVSGTAVVGDHTITVTGMTKGSGMIKPDMATNLSFIACDARIAPACLRKLCRRVADASFNRVTIDGDTSTNDAFVLIATGKVGDAITDVDGGAASALQAAITDVAVELAQRLVRDGEGATKFVTVQVDGGVDVAMCRAVANTIAESPLVKTAMFAGDANWGRFCMAIGRAPVAGLDPDRVALWLDDVPVASGGMRVAEYSEADASAVMAKEEYRVRVDLGLGPASWTVWTSDLSYEYVRINAEYRT